MKLRSVITFIFLLFVGLFLFISEAQAATYYIDATSGDDLKDGQSEANAWKTISKINGESFSAGDSILFKRGETWRKELTVPSSGEAGNQITFGAYGNGDKPLLSGAVLMTGWTDEGGSVYNASLGGIGSLTVVWFDNAQGNKVADKPSLSSNNDWFWDSGVLYVYSTSDPDGRTIEASTQWRCIYQNEKSNLRFENIKTEKSRSANIYVHSDATNIALYNIESDKSYQQGIKIGLWGGAAVTPSNVTIENCSISLFNRENASVGPGIHQYVGTSGGNNLIIRNCNISSDIDTDNPGGTEDGIIIEDGDNVLIENNTIFDTTHGIQMRGSGVDSKDVETFIIRYNFIDSYDDAFWLNGTTEADSTIYYNVVAGTGDQYFDINGEGGTVYNNTCYGGRNNAVKLSNIASSKVIFKNNIVSHVDNGRNILYIDDSIGIDITDSVFDNNLYYRSAPTAPFGTFSSAGTFTFNNWQTTHSQDANGLNEDPLFANGSGGDFTLQSNSSVINGGVNVGLTQDYAENSIPQGGGYDMGAYEFLVPSVASSLAQYKSDGTTIISTGSWTNETSVVLKYSMSSSNSSDSLTPQVELREVGTDFSNSVTNLGDAVVYSGSPVTGTVVVTGLTDGTSYHWQARVSNTAGQSLWTTTGESTDFTIDTLSTTNPSLSSPDGYTKDNTRPTLVFKKATDSGSGISSYSVSLDSGKSRSFSTSGIPATGNGSSSYVWKDDSTAKIIFVNEDDSDPGNDEISVYFKDLDTIELYEGKHTWNVNVYDAAGNETSLSRDFYLDKTQPFISDFAIADAFMITPYGEYKLAFTNRTPSFSGLAIDSYQGSEVTNRNGIKDIYDEVSSAPEKITINIQKLSYGKVPESDNSNYVDYLTDEFILSDIKDNPGIKKYINFYLTISQPLTDGYYKVNLELKDKAGNIYNYSPFYLSLNYNKSLIFPPGQMKIEKVKEETIPATSEEEREKEKVVTVKVIDTDENPIKGAKVTLLSEPKISYTDKDGITTFEGVENGDHTVIVSYKGYKAEEKLTISDDENVKQVNFTIQVTLYKEWYEKPIVIVFCFGILVLSVVTTSIYLKKKNP